MCWKKREANDRPKEHERVLRPGMGGELAGNGEAQIPSETYQVERVGTIEQSMFFPGENSSPRGLEKSAEVVVAMKRSNARGAKDRRK